MLGLVQMHEILKNALHNMLIKNTLCFNSYQLIQVCDRLTALLPPVVKMRSANHVMMSLIVTKFPPACSTCHRVNYMFYDLPALNHSLIFIFLSLSNTS